ncbi:MAG TPA: GPP34 family phosphoprotein [Candidatus Agrococcus pullicola]|uniref:GPP34 family phosphoprotein n=1 Tax=Candidatus Agrococcus pullicola TaxID=2838429 RepID=A0A9D2CBL8_9MICO|nr:GPP34 family phosphoprotein [Candidatus Agrococcus pullicola]
MTKQYENSGEAEGKRHPDALNPEGVESAAVEAIGNPTLAEDLLLLLFQPGSGTIAGENTLFYVLAGAVLADLARDARVATTTTRLGIVNVEAVEGRGPLDEILRGGWDYVYGKPRAVQTVLPAIGPTLRERLLERLVERGCCTDR